MSILNSSLSRRGMIGLSAAAAVGATGCAAGTKSTSSAEGSAAPAGSGSSASASAGKVSGGTLTILNFASDFSKPEIQAFEKEHGCKVVIEEYSFDKLTAMLASNRAPDLCMGDGSTDTPYLATKELAEPLDERLSASSVLKTDDLAGINNLWRYENGSQGSGPLLGLVKDYSSDLTLWVNTSLVGEKAKSTEVWTYDQVLDAAKRGTKQSSGRVESYGYEYYNEKPGIMHLQAMMLSDGKAKLFNDDLTQIDLAQPAGVKAFDFFRQLFEAKATTSALAKSSSNTWQLFESGRLAILQSGYWTQGMFEGYKDTVKNNLVMLPAPQMGADRISPVMGGRGMWIPRTAKNKDLAWAFMEYYFGGAPAQARASSGWGVPALKSLADKMPAKTPINTMALAVQEEENQHFESLTFTPYARATACDLLLRSTLEKGIKSGKSTAEIAADANKAVNDLLKRGKR